MWPSLISVPRGSVAAFGLIGCAFTASSAAAQSPGAAIEIKGIGGYAGFVDDTTISHGVVGVAVRFRRSPSLSIEPEFLYMRASASDQDYAVQVNLAWSSTAETRVRPYVVVGAGVLHHRGARRGAGHPGSSATGLTASGGGGLQIYLSDRWVVSPEARLGVGPTLRATIALGHQFRSSKP